MKSLINLVFIVFSTFCVVAQESPWNENSIMFSKKRFTLASSGITGVWVGGTFALSKIWYDEFQKTTFHTFNDCSDWLQMDKVGHIYTASHLSEANYRLLKWTGLSEKKSVWLGTAVGLGFQTTLEFLDGRNADWGFSWCDMAANGLGSGFFLSQQLLWQEQHILLKFSAHLTEYANVRPHVLGSSVPERLLKDYNGQSYWLSFSPKSMLKNWPLPAWICFSAGYSVDEKLIGSEEFYVTPDRAYQARRQFLLSLDIDVRKLPIQKRWIKTLLRPLHYIKIPFPTLIMSRNGISGEAIYF